MHTLEVVELTVAGFVIFLLGLIVLSRDWRQKSLVAFLVFCGMVAAWSWGIALFINSSLTNALAYANFYYVSAFGIAVMSQIFTSYWLRIRGHKLLFYTALPLLLLVALIITLLASPNFIVQQISMEQTYKAVSFNTYGYALYSLLFLTLFISSFMRLGFATRRLTGLRHIQTEYIVYGLASSGLFGVFFNLILPWFGNYRLTWVGPLSAVIFTGFVGYAIVRRKLFDIRLVLARTIGYTLAIALLASIYGFVVFSIANYVFNLDIPVSAQIWLSAATGFTGLIFPFFRRRFEHLTNRVFYRDAYDVQTMYDQLNQTLVASQTMEGIIMKSLSIIETHLKPEFVLVGLKDATKGQRIFSTRKIKFDPADVAKARKITTHIHHKVIVADNLDDSVARQAELKEIMARNNLAVLVRLAHNVRQVEEGLGYLILGFRKSGNNYSQQDVEVLDTIANELVIAIQNALHVEEIQHFNITLQGRVDEATRRLRQTNKRLKLLDETKDDFISMASHQLRTPLTSVKGYLSMVLEGDAGSINATQRKMLEQSFASSQRMVYLIADLLNVSRLKTGKFMIEPSEVDLASIIEQEVSQLAETAQSREVKIIFKKPKIFPTLMLDETKIRQVIMNFIDNAIYYTPAGGEIKVELAADDKTASLKIIDNGIGVAKSDQHHLFTKFFRASNARQARPDGTGLGLFMANKVVLAQGGHIIFNSVENKGSTFGFRFPIKPLAAATAMKPEKEAIR